MATLCFPQTCYLQGFSLRKKKVYVPEEARLCVSSCLSSCAAGSVVALWWSAHAGQGWALSPSHVSSSCVFVFLFVCLSIRLVSFGAVAVLLSQGKNRLQFGSCIAGRQTSDLLVKTPQWIP